jgi:hypothetical protein
VSLGWSVYRSVRALVPFERVLRVAASCSNVQQRNRSDRHAVVCMRFVIPVCVTLVLWPKTHLTICRLGVCRVIKRPQYKEGARRTCELAQHVICDKRSDADVVKPEVVVCVDNRNVRVDRVFRRRA